MTNVVTDALLYLLSAERALIKWSSWSRCSVRRRTHSSRVTPMLVLSLPLLQVVILPPLRLRQTYTGTKHNHECKKGQTFFSLTCWALMRTSTFLNLWFSYFVLNCCNCSRIFELFFWIMTSSENPSVHNWTITGRKCPYHWSWKQGT